MDPITIWAIAKALAWGAGILGLGWLTYKLIKYTFPEFTTKLTAWVKKIGTKTRIIDLQNATTKLEGTRFEILNNLDKCPNVVDRDEFLRRLHEVNETMALVTKLRKEGAHLLVTREDANGKVIENEKIRIEDPKAQELLRSGVTGDRVLTEV